MKKYPKWLIYKSKKFDTEEFVENKNKTNYKIFSKFRFYTLAVWVSAYIYLSSINAIKWLPINLQEGQTKPNWDNIINNVIVSINSWDWAKVMPIFLLCFIATFGAKWFLEYLQKSKEKKED